MGGLAVEAASSSEALAARKAAKAARVAGISLIGPSGTPCRVLAAFKSRVSCSCFVCGVAAQNGEFKFFLSGRQARGRLKPGLRARSRDDAALARPDGESEVLNSRRPRVLGVSPASACVDLTGEQRRCHLSCHVQRRHAQLRARGRTARRILPHQLDRYGRASGSSAEAAPRFPTLLTQRTGTCFSTTSHSIRRVCSLIRISTASLAFHASNRHLYSGHQTM